MHGLAVAQQLTRAGHTVATAGDGEEAVEAFAAAPPDLLLIDILMPKKGGLVAISEIRKQSPEVPILAMSGGGERSGIDVLSDLDFDADTV